MFVRALASAWAKLATISPSPADPATMAWLAKVSSASPDDVRTAVIDAPDERVVYAVMELLARASEAAASTSRREPVPLLGEVPQLLQRIVSRGHGTNFQGGALAEPHAQFLIGLQNHLVAPEVAHRHYERASLAYAGEHAEGLARISALASATVKRALLTDGDDNEFRRELDRFAELEPVLAGGLDRAWQSYVRVVSWIANARAGPSTAGSDPEGIDHEGAELLGAAALSASDDLPRAMRLARLADAARPAERAETSSLLQLASRLSRQRRWADAVAVLVELLASDPDDRDTAAALARAYTELDRWPEAKAVMIGLLADPPGPADVPTLVDLVTLGRLAHDPAADGWRQVLISLDPEADPLEGMPRAPGTAEAPPPLLAVFSDGRLQVEPALFELPEDERPAHLTAAIVAGTPDGHELLDQLLQEDPQLAERVLALLGFRALTPEQARAHQHFQAGEEHFAARRFELAQCEYEAALQADPDHFTAAMYLGDTWYRRGAYHIAQAYFEESLAIEPSPQAHRFRGDALFHGGHDARRARECYERALQLDPGYRGAREALAALDRREQAGSPPGVVPTGSGAPTTSTAGPDPAQPMFTERASNWAMPEDQPVTDDPPSERVRVLEESRSSGDRVLAAVLRRQGEEGFLGVVDDDERFAQWLTKASPGELVQATLIAVVIAFQYQAKDRDVPRWRHWVLRQRALVEALPPDFGPADSTIELGRDRLLADALQALAGLRMTEQRLPEARSLYKRSLELLSAEDEARAKAGLVGEPKYDQLFSPTSVRASILTSLADVCSRLGDDAAANEYYRQAIRHDAARPTTEAEVDAFIDRAYAAAQEGERDAALGFYQHALYLAEDEDPDPMVPRMLTKALNGLGSGYHELGVPRAALACFQRARRLNERTGNADRLAHDHLGIARVLRDRPALGGGDVGDAREHLERALIYASVPEAHRDGLGWTASDGTSHRISAPDRAWPVLLALASLLQDIGDDPAAAHFLTIATRLADLVRAGVVDEQQRIAVHNQQIEAFVQLTKVYTRLARRGDAPAAAGYADAAWLANESMRARTFLDALGDADLAPPPGVHAPLLARESDLLTRRRLLHGSGRNDGDFWAEHREIADELDALWQHMCTVEPAAEGYVEVRQARPTDRDDLTAILNSDTRPIVLASLVQVDDGALGVLALRGDGCAPVIETRPVDVPRLNRFVRQNFGLAGRVRELAVDLEDLFQHELSPVGELLTAVCDPEELLIVCPVGVLHHVPLAALRPRGRLLLERNPMALLPSASVLRALRTAAHHEPATPADVFGDPTGDLPGARSEALAIAARFGVTASIGADASTRGVRRALCAAGVVHVAAHASFDAGDALASGVVLADGKLTGRDILALNAPALSLVVLSACETGVIENDVAEELVGLTRALLFAGADAIVVSLWKVPDVPTVGIMGGFYEGIANGQSKVDALRGAVLAARDQYGPDRMDRWAGFQLVGDWR